MVLVERLGLRWSAGWTHGEAPGGRVTAVDVLFCESGIVMAHAIDASVDQYAHLTCVAHFAAGGKEFHGSPPGVLAVSPFLTPGEFPPGEGLYLRLSGAVTCSGAYISGRLNYRIACLWPRRDAGSEPARAGGR